MNNNYYPNYSMPSGYPNQEYAPNVNNTITYEQSYIENVLRLNKGKLGKFYCTFPDSNEWRDTVFSGIIEQAARDHLVISNPSTGKWYLIQMIYLNYCEFDEKINYLTNF
jgi:spore germination protein Q